VVEYRCKKEVAVMFNERFKAIRKNSGKTQKELAEFLNISPQSVSKWETGEALPGIEYLPLMAKFFSCSINAFFEDAHENTLPLKISEEIKLSEDMTAVRDRLCSAFSTLGLDVEITRVYDGVRIYTFICTVVGQTKADDILDNFNSIRETVDDKICIKVESGEKDTVIVEIPKGNFTPVPLSDILESEEYKQTECNIPVVIGCRPNGEVIIEDLALCKHILIGGGVRSGKTTFLRNVLACLTSRFSQEELKLVVSDIKKSDLTYADAYPHLMGSVLTEIGETERVLKCLVEEMQSRREALKSFAATNIEQYNEIADERIPRIVIVIDELVDLLAYSKEIPDMLVELTRYGCAVGVHLVMATERPHGKLAAIKAYVSSRVCFVTENVKDSRAIIDSASARALSGYGDMLYSGLKYFSSVRAQAPYIDENEALKLVKI
jgi:S-DNA-T family DNA segregation ATPase FtsK/SpoIIIE